MTANRLLVVASVAAVFGASAVTSAQTGPIPRFFGPVNQDGCGFCCEFNCQRTPTPVPEFDQQGRRVFRRSQGSFMLVAEAGIGLSNRLPGSEGVFNGSTVLPITNASGRPSVEILPDHKMGNGSPAVDCRTHPPGGLKAFPGKLDFPPGDDVTTGLIDMACRFEVATSSSVACTRNRSGDYAFIGTGTARQYCFQVSPTAALQPGDNVFALEFRDVAGNLGPRQEIVIRVEGGLPAISSTPTPSPTPTPTAAGVAGRIRYFSADRPVPSAFVQLNASAPRNTTTSATGNYAFANLSPGNVVVQPHKTGDFGNPTAITALDASWVLQSVSGARSFDASQRLAADVTGDGTVSVLDATRILQRQVGMLTRFAVADRCNSDWIFRPMPGAALNQRLIQPSTSGGTCVQGGIALEPLVGNATQQNFLGILFGDPTGNWQPPPTGAALQRLAASSFRLRVRAARPAGMGGRLRLPVAIKGEEPYYSLDLTVVYDSDLLKPVAVKKLRAASSALAVFNTARPGVVRIAVASADPMPFGLSVVAIDFEGSAPSDAIRVTRAMVDDLPAEIVD